MAKCAPCPVIRVKCRRKYSAAASDGPSFKSKAAAYMAAKKKLRAAFRLSGFGNVHPQAEATSLPPSTVERVAKAAKNTADRCTVTAGGRSWKNLTGAKAAQKISQLIRQQKAKRCIPKVVR